ncbi:hypothetical protein [Nocardioides sp. TF02-7]|uniref:hypothetical protein n=1 Tax=Nocardioides sp. TF02-7 TaxID=2917724 RepID=UPI001F05E4AB|nr:hypothetical protein [Nocardioides sp. TF02-7]UMG94324.1 hypothetical protein MF408_10130 [Nocardioides sp. TF02-7]
MDRRPHRSRGARQPPRRRARPHPHHPGEGRRPAHPGAPRLGRAQGRRPQGRPPLQRPPRQGDLDPRRTLTRGVHKVRLVAVDAVGNRRVVTWRFRVR